MHLRADRSKNTLFLLSISVRCVNLIQIGTDGTSAAVIYHRGEDAQLAVVRLTDEIWDGRRLTVSPSYNRTSVHAAGQQCKLEAHWFLTGSECSAKLIFTEKADAQKVASVLEQAFKCQCRLHMNSVHTTVRCQWPYEDHQGQGFVNFDTTEQARVYLRRQTIGPMNIVTSKKSSSSIFVVNIPKEVDEVDLKVRFPDSTRITLLYASKTTRLASTSTQENYIRRIFGHCKSFRSSDLMVKGQLFHGKIDALAHFTDENEAEVAVREINGQIGDNSRGKIRLWLVKTPTNSTTIRKEDQYVLFLTKLPPQIHEETIRQLLIEKHLADSLSFVRVARKKLPEEQSLPKNQSQKSQLPRSLRLGRKRPEPTGSLQTDSEPVSVG